MMSIANTTHRASGLITEDYEYIGSVDTNPRDGDSGGWAWWTGPDRVLANERFDTWNGQCDHCGSRPRYIAFLRHIPSGSAIIVGETCLDNRFGRATADFQRLRKQSQLDREGQRIVGLLNEFAAANPDLAWAADRKAEIPALHARNGFLQDVVRKLRQYGSLSERQLSAIRVSIVRDEEWAAERAAKAAADANKPKTACPAGRVAVVGTVVSTKWVESDFGGSLKMLVEADDGYRVFGSVAATLGTPGKGTRVKFAAQVEPSRNDPHFGFFKRPTQATTLA